MIIKRVVIEDICDFVGGSQPPKEVFISEYEEGYIRLIQIRDYKTDRFITYIPTDTAKRFCNKQDIMIGRYGPPIYQILRGIDGAYNVALMKAVPKPNILNDYLYYLLKQEAIFKYVEKLSLRTGGQTGVDLDSLNQYPVLLPNLSYQQNVVNVLKTLDSKIELNNRINAELEAMAKMLYDYWFVQFDFPDKNGKPYKTSGGKMVWNEELKRDIPDATDWDIGTLLDIAEYINGLPCQKFRPTGNDYLRVIKIKEMHEGFSSETELVRPDIPRRAIIENGDVLFSWSASLEVQIWTGGKGALNQHIFKVTSDKYPKSFYFYQLINYLQHFKMMAENRKTTMGHITQEHLQQSRIAIPPKYLTKELEKIIAPIFERKMINEMENQKLSELRDWLLPMLMNGQVKVN